MAALLFSNAIRYTEVVLFADKELSTAFTHTC